MVQSRASAEGRSAHEKRAMGADTPMAPVSIPSLVGEITMNCTARVRLDVNSHVAAAMPPLGGFLRALGYSPHMVAAIADFAAAHGHLAGSGIEPEDEA